MKHARSVALATALAAAVVAIGFSSTAVAAKTCSTSGTGVACAAGHGNELTTQAFVASSEGQTWNFTSGFITVKCEAQINGEFTHEGKGKITAFTFTNCTSSLGACSSFATNASSANPWAVAATASGSGNGTLAITASPITWTFTCAGTTCKYTTTEMGGKNGSVSVTGGEPGKLAFASIAVSKEEGSSAFCSATATREGTFSVTTPNSLWIE